MFIAVRSKRCSTLVLLHLARFCVEGNCPVLSLLTCRIGTLMLLITSWQSRCKDTLIMHAGHLCKSHLQGHRSRIGYNLYSHYHRQTKVMAHQQQLGENVAACLSTDLAGQG